MICRGARKRASGGQRCMKRLAKGALGREMKKGEGRRAGDEGRGARGEVDREGGRGKGMRSEEVHA